MKYDVLWISLKTILCGMINTQNAIIQYYHDAKVSNVSLFEAYVTKNTLEIIWKQMEILEKI